jgi:hypothetical protein
MTLTSSGTVLFRNTMRITDGHLGGFRQAIAQAVAFAEEHGPQLMVDVFIDEERMLAHSFQLYRDSDAVRTHWRLSASTSATSWSTAPSSTSRCSANRTTTSWRP